MGRQEHHYTDLQHVGKKHVRKDAREIVTGKAIFVDDYVVPGMLYGRILRSPHAHAMITSINVDKAKAHPGVHAVLT